MTVSEIDEIERLHHSTVKNPGKLVMRRQVGLASTPTPRVIDVDALSTNKRHVYQVIVSDLDRRRLIQVGGEGHKEENLDGFFEFISKTKCNRIKLVAMGVWKAFRNSRLTNALKALIIYDKFHITHHLPQRLEQVRREQYKKLSVKGRSYIKD